MNELEVAMTRARKVNPDGYVHARDAKEYQRLRDQARMWQEATAQGLATIGLGPGMNCLDVGCGLGAAMQLMAERGGPEGRITGIESDAALAAQSLNELRREGGAHFELIAADLVKCPVRPHLLPAPAHAYA
jgi:ubiquinone/menaquinone biosynthesis C-methylase UbiE